MLDNPRIQIKKKYIYPNNSFDDYTINYIYYYDFVDNCKVLSFMLTYLCRRKNK